MSYDTAAGTVIYRCKMHPELERNFQFMPGAEWRQGAQRVRAARQDCLGAADPHSL